MKTVLIDASFLAKLLGLHGEVPCLMAQKKVENSLLVASSLIEYELGNILLKYPELNAKTILRIFKEYCVRLFPIFDMSQVVSLAKAHGLTFYDASYLEILFFHPDVEIFFTCDRDFSEISDNRIVLLR